MIRFHALGVCFCLPLLTLLAPLLALRLGMRGSLSSLAISLCAHELAHILAAKCLRVEISEIRILPFGGSARMENPYQLAPQQIIPVALAGPAANLMLMLICAALAHWQGIPEPQAAEIIRTSLVLMLFNLLPALPLDGGRTLYAMLERPLGEARALKLGIWLGRGLALALGAGTVLLRLRGGKWNLSFLLAAVFILNAEHDERAALGRSRAQRLERLLASEGNALPARFYHLDARTPLHRALQLMRPRENAWFMLTEAGVPQVMVDGRSVLRSVLEGSADAPLSSLPAFPLTQKERDCRI